MYKIHSLNYKIIYWYMNLIYHYNFFLGHLLWIIKKLYSEKSLYEVIILYNFEWHICWRIYCIYNPWTCYGHFEIITTWYLVFLFRSAVMNVTVWQGNKFSKSHSCSLFFSVSMKCILVCYNYFQMCVTKTFRHFLHNKWTWKW